MQGEQKSAGSGGERVSDPGSDGRAPRPPPDAAVAEFEMIATERAPPELLPAGRFRFGGKPLQVCGERHIVGGSPATALHRSPERAVFDR